MFVLLLIILHHQDFACPKDCCIFYTYTCIVLGGFGFDRVLEITCVCVCACAWLYLQVVPVVYDNLTLTPDK